MKKKTKALIVVLLCLLCAGFVTGAVLTRIQYKNYYNKVNKADFMDLAFLSIDDAYDQLNKCDTFKTLSNVFIWSSIGCVVILIGFLVVNNVMNRMKERNKITMYGAMIPGQMPVQGVQMFGQGAQQPGQQSMAMGQGMSMGQPPVQQGSPMGQPNMANTLYNSMPNGAYINSNSSQIAGAEQVAVSMEQKK